MNTQPRRNAPPRLRPVALAAASALGLLAAPLQAAGPAPNALPGGLNVVHGQAEVATVLKGTAAQMTVRNTAGAILNWASFDIGAQAGVHFQQADATSKVLNRVTGSDPSRIFGSLTSNGQVWLLNPQGVLFGAGARVDVAGLVASTLRLDNNAFLDGLRSGRFSFAEGAAGATLRNDGAIRTANGGHLVLLGENVANTGTLDAPGGALLLAGARSATLVDSALPHLAALVPAGEVLNLGRAAADGGLVDVYAAVVNQQGLVRADTLGVDAQGRIVLKAADTLMLAGGSTTQAAGAAEGAAGGRIDLLGAQVGLVGDAVVDASGTAGGGAVRVGGGLMGQDRSVDNARAVYIGPEATLRADTTGATGTGGSLIVWSDEATRAYGRLSARGGALAGDGGFIETSGGWIDARPAQVDVASRGGRAGTWLIDPNNLTISDTGPDTAITGGPSFTTTGDGAVITTATIAAALNAGTSVTLTTALTGGTEAGDIFMSNATLAVAPPTGVTLTLQATRDIVVQDSSITSSGAALNLDFRAAGNGAFGVISIANSSITTAGGNLTMGGSTDRPLPLPGGGLTAGSFRPARAYSSATGGSSSALGGGLDAVRVESSLIDLGAGTFRAVGEGALDARDGVVLSSDSGNPMRLSAAQVQLIGHSPAPDAVDLDRIGVIVGGQNTEVVATDAILIQAAGDEGGTIESGARVRLAGGGAGSVLLEGWGGARGGLVLLSWDADTDTAGRGTTLTVSGGTLVANGRSAFGGTGVLLDNSLGAPGPLLDLAAATGTSTLAALDTGSNLVATGVDIVLPTAGTLTLSAAGFMNLNEVFATGAGGALSLAAPGLVVENSVFSSTAGALALDFATPGPSPSGVAITNTIIETRGGDVRFGDLRTVSSPILGATAAPGFWLESDSSDTAAALAISDSVIDAGSGRILGGGAIGASGFDRPGVVLFRSVFDAASIELAGRSDYAQGLINDEATLRATRVLALTGESAGNFPPSAQGLFIGERSTLQLLDPTNDAGSRFELTGRKLGDGVGLLIEGGAVGSGNETRLSIEGADALLAGQAGSGSGLVMRGSAAGSGGAFISAALARQLQLDGAVELDAATGGTGTGLQLFHARVIGPQRDDTTPLVLRANGGGATGAGLKLEFSSLGSGGPMTLAGNSVLVSNSLLASDAGLSVLAVDRGASEGSVQIDQSALQVAGAGARLFVGTRVGGPAIGVAGLAGGAGVLMTDSVLEASDVGGTVEVRGQGAATGGRGVEFTRTNFTADSLTLVGRGGFDGDGVYADNLDLNQSTLSVTSLLIDGVAAHDPAATSHTRGGVVLGRGVQLLLGTGGAAQITGDIVSLGLSGGMAPATATPFVAVGSPASFSVSTTRSMMLREATLDFSAGSGTDVTLRADTDNFQGGRVRLNSDSLIRSGGGDVSIEGQGALAAVPAAGLPSATVVFEGGIGVYLTGARVEAGTGTVTLTGRTVDDPGVAGTEPALAGVVLGGTAFSNRVSGARVVINGTGLGAGFGVVVGEAGSTVSHEIDADQVEITGTGAGSSLATGIRAPGIRLLAGGNVEADSSLQLAGSGGSGVELDAGQASSLGSLTVASTGPVRFTGGASAQAVGALVITGSGRLAEAPAVAEQAVWLRAGSTVRGASVTVVGAQPDNTLPAVELLAESGGGTLQATAGDLVVRADTGYVEMTGAWSVAATGLIDLRTEQRLALGAGATDGLSPSFSAANLQLDIHGLGPVSVAPGGDLDPGLFSSGVAGLSAASTVTLRVSNAAPVAIDGTLAVPGRLRLRADGVTLVAGSQLTAGGTGDALVVGGNAATATPAFLNEAGASALATPAGRWLILSSGPASTTLGGLLPAFSAYGLDGTPWLTDGDGNLVTPLAGNALGYGIGTAGVSGAALAVSQTRPYDASASLTLDPGSWSVTGLVPGDTLLLAGSTAASMADKAVGVDKPVTADAAAVFSVVDAGGLPVFGYEAPALRATITPLALTVTGTTAANKVYDATTAATLASLGSVTPLPGDVVAVGGTVVAAFADRNAGLAKPVLATGFALTGADAGNYTLVPPTGLVADITPLALPVTGLVAGSRVYDATALAPLSGTAGIAPIGGDAVVLAGTALGSFADKNVGTAKAVFVTGLSLAGADAGNYSLVPPTGLVADITPAALAVTGLSALSRPYDRGTVAPLAGAAGIAPLAGDSVTLAGTAVGSFATAAVGTAKPVAVGGLSLAGADAGNYTLLLPAGLSADVTPLLLSLAGATATGRVYDGSTAVVVAGSLTGVLTGDAVGVALTGTLPDANVGSARPVAVAGALTGADAGNYSLSLPLGLVADITPATLAYVAVPAFGTAGQPLPVLTGTVSGLLGTDTLATATTGTLAWTTPATAGSPAGRYAISGGGLAASNYLFVQDAANASALTLRAAAVGDPVSTTTTVITASSLLSVGVPVFMSTPTSGRTLDVTPAFAGSLGAAAERLAGGAPAPAVPGASGAPAAPGAPALPGTLPGLVPTLGSLAGESGGLRFGALDFSRLPRDEVQTLLAARARYKQQVFADGIHRLQEDPTLADVRACRNEAELDSGQCLITEELKRQIQAARAAIAAADAARRAAESAQLAQANAEVATLRPGRAGQRRVVQATLPVIERKLALVIGVNDYRDKAVPQLEGAVRDARAIRERLEQRLGYETTVLESPTREQIVRAFNRLALEAQATDSVIVYYAGHGVLVPVEGVETGFWLPSDVDSRNEKTWLSNADIARLLATIGSKQLMLVSDSCYSGTLVGRERVAVGGASADELLQRRAAVVMSSGGDEPVADEGKDGHSFFAWHLMRALEGLDGWQPGSNLYERLRTAVSREFPQTPQYGASRGLGHEGNTDYLFERRELEAAAKAP